MAALNVLQWLRYGPWLAQVVVTRRRNLTCGYCTEYDRTSNPAPCDELALRLAKLAELRAWAVCLTGGEPTMHPRLTDLVAEMKRLGFKGRMLITNGTRLTAKLVEALNGAGLTDMQISVDGVKPNKVTAKTLQPLRKKLELLAEKATFRVVKSGVVGSAPPEDALEVVDFAKAMASSREFCWFPQDRQEVQMSVDPTQIVEDVGYALLRDGRIVEIGSRRANGKIAYLQFKFEDLSSGRLPLASVRRFLQSR